MTVERRSGRWIIGGSFPRAGIKLTITDPSTSTKPIQVTSGPNLKYGPGGFEVDLPIPKLLRNRQLYVLTFLNQTFQVEIGPEPATIITFTEKGESGPVPARTLTAGSIPVLGKWKSFSKLARSPQKPSRER
jgi:hypothetical protein